MTNSTPSDITTREELAAALTSVRESTGLTIRALSRALQAPASTIGGYFSGRHLPPPGELPRLLRACGVPEEETEAWLEATRRVRASGDRRITRTRAPYRGLDPYDEDDADLFRGREETTGRITELVLGETPLVAVVGASGSGKSSILRAGVVPSLRLHGLTCVVLTPGADPVTALDEALTAAPDVVVIDQFEEVFTLADAPRRAAFLDRLAGGPRVVIGVRADFYAAAAREDALRPALRSAQVLVGPMREDDVRAAITAPAAVVGVQVDDALVDLLIAELRPRQGSDAGTLPLLSYALLACWQRSRTGRLTVADYRATGGIDAAIQRVADELYAGLTRPQQALTRRVFLRLVTVEGDVAVTRRLLSWDELEALDASGQGLEIVGRFVDARLLTAGVDHVEISHEALLSAWPRLREWVSEDRTVLRLQHQISAAANEWHDHGRDPSLLWRGVRLDAASELRSDPVRNAELTLTERDFADAGATLAAFESSRERRRANRLRTLLGVSVVLLAVAVALGVVAVRAERNAKDARDDALSRQVASTALLLRQADPALAQQLILAAYRIAPTSVARAAMIDGSAGPILTRILGRPGPTPLALSPDGRVLAVADAINGAIRLYRTRPGRPPVLAGHIDGPRLARQSFALAFSPDGRTLASGGEDKHVRLWDVTTPSHPTVLATLGPDFGGDVQSVAFAPDGSAVVAASAGPHPVQAWSMHGFAALPAPGGIAKDATIHSVAVDRSGRLAAGGTNGIVYVWPRISEDATPTTFHHDSATIDAVLFDPHRAALYVGDTTGVTRTWSLDGVPAVTATIADSSNSPVDQLAVSRDGTRLAVGVAANTVTQWLTADPRSPLTTTPGGGPVTGLAYSPDGAYLIIANADGSVRLRPTAATGIPVAGTVFNLVYNRSATTLAVVTNGADGVRLWNLRSGQPWGPPLQMPSPGVGGAGTMTADGSLVVGGDAKGRIMLWDTKDPARPLVAAGPLQIATDQIETIAVNPAGTRIAVASDDGSLTVMDVRNPRAPRTLAVVHGAGIMFGAAFSRDGDLLAGGNSDHTVYVWNIADPTRPRRVAHLGGFLSYVWGVTFSPTENVLAATGSDHTVRLWDLSTPTRPAPVGPVRVGPTDYVYSTAFSPDGQRFAAASNDRTVRVYRVHSGTDNVPELTLQQPNAPVWSVAFTPDGTTLTSGGRDATLSTWTLDPSDYARRLCAAAGDPITRNEWALYVPGAKYNPPCR